MEPILVVLCMIFPLIALCVAIAIKHCVNYRSTATVVATINDSAWV